MLFEDVTETDLALGRAPGELRVAHGQKRVGRETTSTGSAVGSAFGGFPTLRFLKLARLEKVGCPQFIPVYLPPRMGCLKTSTN